MRTIATQKIATALDALREDFKTSVEKLATLAHAEMLPYFEKRGWSYLAGNGTWYITDRKGNAIDDNKLPKAIRDLLWLEVDCNDCLGFWIRDIKGAR